MSGILQWRQLSQWGLRHIELYRAKERFAMHRRRKCTGHMHERHVHRERESVSSILWRRNLHEWDLQRLQFYDPILGTQR